MIPITFGQAQTLKRRYNSELFIAWDCHTPYYFRFSGSVAVADYVRYTELRFAVFLLPFALCSFVFWAMKIADCIFPQKSSKGSLFFPSLSVSCKVATKLHRKRLLLLELQSKRITA